ncbi:MAG: hybrid sensor histidine kinase/response regulator [Acidobacteria bacterium]|nr:MAG: hybrid sensor histidine kinase/response regulator [Acidobacteriota bacterium]
MAQAGKGTKRAARARILVVEDEGIVAEDIQYRLENLGYAVPAVASSGEEAMKIAAETRPDLVLMDVVLKGTMNGVEAAKQMRDLFNIPVVYLTAYSDDNTLQGAKVTEPLGYVLKPFEERELQTTIEMALYRHEMERKLRESRQWLATTLRCISDAVIATDTQGRVKFMNAVAEDLTGWKQEEALGKELSRIFKANHSILISRDGREISIDDSAAPIKDDHGDISGVVLVFRDISERKHAEDALRQSEERYRNVVERSIQGIMIHQDSIIQFANPAFARIFGYSSPEEVIGINIWTDLIPPEERELLQARTAACLRGESIPVHQAWQAIHKNGTRVWIESGALRIMWHDRPAILAFLIDATERKNLEDQLRQTQRMEAVGKLAGGVAHDFNNLLTAITGYASLLLLKLQSDDPLRKDVDEIRKAGERAAALTSQLLAFSRKQILAPQNLDLNQLVANMDKMLRRLISEDIDLVTVPEKPLGWVKADPGQIEQVIVNLVVNARDAMPTGGKLTLETANVQFDEAYALSHVEVTPGPYAMLAVSDTGCGMDEETLSRIFEPFFTTKELGKGTGLGLSTVYGIVRQSGGHIWVYSEPTRGTTFKIYLPQVVESVRPLELSKGVTDLERGSETVLLVEDEEIVRNLVRNILQRKGYTVLEACNGNQALQVSESHSGPIHLLVTDVVMPGMSGRELAERVMTVRGEVKVLYMSGYTENAISRHGFLDPGVAFIQKPFTLAILTRTVRQVLDRTALYPIS